MTKLTHQLLIAALLFAHAASGQVRMKGLEAAVESSTSLLRVPQELPSTLAIPTCPEGCARVTLRVEPSAKFLLGARPVTLDEFRKAAESPSQNLAIFYDPETSVVTRMVIFPGSR